MTIKLETTNLVLRPFTIEDAPPVMQMSKERLSKKWLPNQICENIQEATDLLTFLISEYERISYPIKNTVVLGIESRRSSMLIGHIGLSPFKSMMEIGYAIGDSHQNNGYATEAVSSFTNWLLCNAQLKSVFGLVDSENTASQRVLLKSGYSQTGIFPGKEYGKKNRCQIYEKNIDTD